VRHARNAIQSGNGGECCAETLHASASFFQESEVSFERKAVFPDLLELLGILVVIKNGRSCYNFPRAVSKFLRKWSIVRFDGRHSVAK
jgi:hypothetical protein